MLKDNNYYCQKYHSDKEDKACIEYEQELTKVLEYETQQQNFIIDPIYLYKLIASKIPKFEFRQDSNNITTVRASILNPFKIIALDTRIFAQQ